MQLAASWSFCASLHFQNVVVFRQEQKTAQALLAEIKATTHQWTLAGCTALHPLFVVHVVSE